MKRRRRLLRRVETAALVVFWVSFLAWPRVHWPYDGAIFVTGAAAALVWVKLRDRRERTMRFTIPRDTYDDLRRWQDAGALTPNHQARTAIFRYVADLRRYEHRHGPAQTITVSPPPESGTTR